MPLLAHATDPSLCPSSLLQANQLLDSDKEEADEEQEGGQDERDQGQRRTVIPDTQSVACQTPVKKRKGKKPFVRKRSLSINSVSTISTMRVGKRVKKTRNILDL